MLIVWVDCWSVVYPGVGLSLGIDGRNVIDMSDGKGQLQFLSLMFVDIPGGVRIRGTAGGDVERDYLDHCISVISVVRKQHNGSLVRTVGSTLLCSFESGEEAVLAACDMQEAVERVESKGVTPALRIGLHAGNVEIRSGSCVGDAVTTAARIVTLAKPRQIVATGAVFEQVSNKYRHRLMPLENAAAMEMRLQVKLFRVTWGKPTGDAEISKGGIPGSEGAQEDKRTQVLPSMQGSRAAEPPAPAKAAPAEPPPPHRC